MAKTFLNTKITELVLGVHEIGGVKRKTVLTNDLFSTLEEQRSYKEWLTSVVTTTWFYDLREGENYIQVEEDLFAFTLPTVRSYFSLFFGKRAVVKSIGSNIIRVTVKTESPHSIAKAIPITHDNEETAREKVLSAYSDIKQKAVDDLIKQQGAEPNKPEPFDVLFPQDKMDELKAQIEKAHVLEAEGKKVQWYIYIATDTPFPGRFKIGCTSDPQERIKSLNRETPFEVVFFAVFKMGKLKRREAERIEKGLHNIFKAANCNYPAEKGGGFPGATEWFFFKPGDIRPEKMGSMIARLVNAANYRNYFHK